MKIAITVSVDGVQLTKVPKLKYRYASYALRAGVKMALRVEDVRQGDALLCGNAQGKYPNTDVGMADGHIYQIVPVIKVASC